jgi:hypothetical protein
VSVQGVTPRDPVILALVTLTVAVATLAGRGSVSE